MKVPVKTEAEIEIMAEGGKISAAALKNVLESIKPGVKTMDLEEIASDTIVSLGGKPSFKTVVGYNYATCININEGLVHGLPNDYKISEGDVVSVDMGTLYKGFHTDLSYTVEVGTTKEQKFLEQGKEALEAGIQQCVAGNKIGDISNAMQVIIEGNGWSVSRELVGHGIGVELHEEPYVPGYGKKGKGPELKNGMVLAVEIIYQKGSFDIQVADDDWTIVTADGSLAGLFEHTVAITKSRPRVLTRP